jgi:hypothetical protein
LPAVYRRLQYDDRFTRQTCIQYSTGDTRLHALPRDHESARSRSLRRELSFFWLGLAMHESSSRDDRRGRFTRKRVHRWKLVRFFTLRSLHFLVFDSTNADVNDACRCVPLQQQQQQLCVGRTTDGARLPLFVFGCQVRRSGPGGHAVYDFAVSRSRHAQ